MGLMNEVKGGADLTHPHMSVGWVVGAVVAIVILAFAAGIGFWLYGKAKSAVSGKMTSGGSGTLESTINTQGWL